MRLINTILQNFFKDKAGERLTKVIFPSFIVQSFSVLAGFIISILLARGLGASDYGIFTYVFSMVFLVVNLSSSGLNILAVRETSAFLAEGKTPLLKGFFKWSSVIVWAASLVLAVALAILTYCFHIMPNSAYTTPMLIAAISIPFYTILSFYSSFLRGMHKIVLSLLSESVIKQGAFLIVVAISYFLLKKMALMDMVYLNTLTFGIGFLLAVVIFRKSARLSGITPQYDTTLWWNKLGALFLLNGLISLESRVDIIMLGYLKDSAQVGIFSAASKVASFLSFFLMTANFIIAPLISKLNTLNERQRLQNMVTKTIRWVTLCSLPFFIIMVFASKVVMRTIFGFDFEQGQTALIIIGCAQLISIVFGPVGNLMMMSNNEKYYTIFTFFSIIITIVLNFILIPSMGYNGAAIATACSIIFWNAALYITTKRKLGISAWIFG